LLAIVLEEVSSPLNNVVVVGYGSTIRKDLTGAVVSIDVKTLADVPPSIPLTMHLPGKRQPYG
jgi:hypothetical protein